MRISRRCRCSRLLCVGFVLSLTVLVVHLVSISDQLDHSLSGKEGNHRKEAYQRIKPNATVSPIDKLLSKLHVTGLEDIYFAVKTTQAYHRKRLQVLLDTWVSLVKKQVRSPLIPNMLLRMIFFINIFAYIPKWQIYSENVWSRPPFL